VLPLLEELELLLPERPELLELLELLERPLLLESLDPERLEVPLELLLLGRLTEPESLRLELLLSLRLVVLLVLLLPLGRLTDPESVRLELLLSERPELLLSVRPELLLSVRPELLELLSERVVAPLELLSTLELMLPAVLLPLLFGRFAVPVLSILELMLPEVLPPEGRTTVAGALPSLWL
jgi:hypothetical protein